jgi:heat shock protein HtpX
MNILRTGVLLAGLTGLFLAVGFLIGGEGGLVIAFALALALNAFAYWNSDKLVLRMYGARPVSETEAPTLVRLVRQLADQAELPMPKVFVMESDQPNAFATGRNPNHAAVCVTEGLLQGLTWEEIRGVLAHELAHIRNRDILIGSVAATIATAISYAANMAMWGAMFGGGGDDDDSPNPIVMLLFAILAPIAAGLIQMAISRSREFEADRTAARWLNDGEPLARALEKLHGYSQRIPSHVQPAQASHYIVNPLAGSKMTMANLFSTHPRAEERIRILRSGQWRSLV